MNDRISAVQARQVLDSRGTPTVEVEVHCAGGAIGRAIVPSGASTGKHEALELRDGDPKDYAGKSVHKAVANVRQVIAPAVVSMAATEQAAIDRKLIELDGMPDKSRLGANAILGVSLACAHAAAASRKAPLWQYLDRRPHAPREASVARSVTPTIPMPMVNLISGGLHAGRNLDMQDFLLMPIGAKSFSEALHLTTRVYRSLSETLRDHGYEGVLVGDEGGFGPKLGDNERALEMILEAFDRLELVPGRDVAIAIDVASTHFHEGGLYRLKDTLLSATTMAAMLTEWADRYPIVSIEDGMAEDDWAGWKTLTESLGQRVQLIGDDLFATNPRRLAQGIEQGVANAILIKVNQIGTLTETLQVIDQAHAAGYRCVISARSGETEDSTIADLAVATGVGQIKIGSVARSERLAKYNQLLRIEEQMGPGAPFATWQPIERPQ
ncbi:MAG: phosphopyruvate hydratase [Planctomycetes bacterium]|nr:phosphopyruvate hydratase [Planctomycetota bacterium]